MAPIQRGGIGIRGRNRRPQGRGGDWTGKGGTRREEKGGGKKIYQRRGSD